MNSIESINSGLFTSQTSGVGASGRVGGMQPPPPPPGMGGMGGVDGMEKSGPAEMMSQLEELQEEDPETFQSVMEQIAAEIEAAAAEEEEATGSAGRLGDLAAKFREAAKSGDLSVLQPPEPPSFAESMDPSTQYQMQEDSARAGMMAGGAGMDPRDRMQELFTKIFSIVDNAVAGLSTE